eukprot:s3772_g2.t1
MAPKPSTAVMETPTKRFKKPAAAVPEPTLEEKIVTDLGIVVKYEHHVATVRLVSGAGLADLELEATNAHGPLNVGSIYKLEYRIWSDADRRMSEEGAPEGILLTHEYIARPKCKNRSRNTWHRIWMTELCALNGNRMTSANSIS